MRLESDSRPATRSRSGCLAARLGLSLPLEHRPAGSPYIRSGRSVTLVREDFSEQGGGGEPRTCRAPLLTSRSRGRPTDGRPGPTDGAASLDTPWPGSRPLRVVLCPQEGRGGQSSSSAATTVDPGPAEAQEGLLSAGTALPDSPSARPAPYMRDGESGTLEREDFSRQGRRRAAQEHKGAEGVRGGVPGTRGRRESSSPAARPGARRRLHRWSSA